MLSDRKLWESFLSGDGNSFKMIYERSIQDLFAYGRSFCSDEEIVKDCIHDLFIEIYNTRTRLSSTDKILPYLMVVLKRIIIRKLRKDAPSNSLNIEYLPFVLEIREEEEDIAVEETLQSLRNALRELTPRQREAIHLKYVAGLSYDELAKVMDLNYQTSRNLVSRAILKLRVILNKEELVVLLVLTIGGGKKR
ncbi:sigma-70 family RNA polymerase sigma factor [Maribellus sp. YY47]|uniref:RNA polymerase sigma factor n=1 Tax=Maribellus sp. YY47 TaxID=2929486 RepID=UPI002001595C|nr:sigma-70 family RNA polymerase sigma factor [Maribellus sp. YY47]MCK3684792.1 sigma-70 family RNA polymerase sigma factor [Maribellus sp. YY47]